MGNVVQFEVRGIKELNARMVALQREIGVANIPAKAWIMRALHDGARVIRDEAKRLAPVLRDPQRNPHRRAGELRSGIVEHASRDEYGTVYVRVRTRGYIFAEGPDTRRNPKSSRRAGNPNYWWLVEFGTSQAPAQPFMRPAFERKKAEALRVIVESLRKGLDEIVRRVQQIKIAA